MGDSSAPSNGTKRVYQLRVITSDGSYKSTDAFADSITDAIEQVSSQATMVRGRILSVELIADVYPEWYQKASLLQRAVLSFFRLHKA